MTSVFLSHSHEDRDASAAFVGALRQAGLDVWYSLDRRRGSGFISEIDKALLDADCVVLFETESARESPWVKKELLYVDKVGKRLVVARASPIITSDEYDHIIDAAPSVVREKRSITDFAAQCASLIRSYIRPRGYVAAVWGTKGGTGKSTCVAYLGYAFAELGRKTLIVDLDPQGSATHLLTDGPEHGHTAEVLFQPNKGEIELRASDVSANLKLIGGSFGLSEISVRPDDAHAVAFAAAIEHLRKSYDCILIDCPTGGQFLPQCAVRSCDLLLIPLPPDRMVEKAAEMAIKLVRTEFQPDYPVPISVVLTMVRSKSIDTKQIALQMADKFSDFRPLKQQVLKTVELTQSRPEDAFRKRGLFRSSRSKSAQTFLSLAKEIDRRIAQGARFRANALQSGGGKGHGNRD